MREKLREEVGWGNINVLQISHMIVQYVIRALQYSARQIPWCINIAGGKKKICLHNLVKLASRFLVSIIDAAPVARRFRLSISVLISLALFQ